MKTLARIVFALFALAQLPGARADSMRCGPWVVNETASVAEVLEKCGEPQHKETRTEDVLSRNPTTGFVFKVGTRVVERWIYQRSQGSLPMAVTIIDGKIQKLERSD